MNAVLGRILTGTCGGLVMAGFNRWNSWEGWLYWTSIGAAFAVAFAAALLVERRNAAVRSPSSGSNEGLGSFNEAEGTQAIEIDANAIRPEDAVVGSHNKTAGDQKIRIGKS